MRAPGRRGQQLDLLGGDEGPKLHGEAFDEVLVGEHRGPVRAAIGVVVELPEMHELVDHPRVGLEVAPISFLSWPPFRSAGKPNSLYSLTASPILPTCSV